MYYNSCIFSIIYDFKKEGDAWLIQGNLDILRESRDDYGENYDRIEVQRDILEQFCQK